MSARWRVVDLLDYSGDVSTRPGRIVAGDQEFPLSDVTCVLTGTDTRWTSGVVAMAATFDVPIVACDWRGIPIAVTMPWSANSRVAARQRAQAELSLPRRKNAWMRIVQAKVRGQAANLPPGAPRERLLDLARRVRSGDPDNIEAQAARTYWSRVFAPEPFSRNRDRPGRNALLNYGYAVLRGVVVRAICVAGLTPTLSIQHIHRANVFALADDLIEPFRPAVDHVVAAMDASATPTDPAARATLVGTLSLKHGRSGVTVQTAITELAQSMATYAEGRADRLSVHPWQPSDG